MTERLTANITLPGGTISAPIDINPLPIFTYTWMTFDGSTVINPGSSASPPNYIGGDGLIQVNTYRLRVNVSNFPPGTHVTMSTAPITWSGGIFFPADVSGINSNTDSSRNAYFNVAFNPTPAGMAVTPNPYGNTNDIYAAIDTRVADVNGFVSQTVRLIVPVLFNPVGNYVNWTSSAYGSNGYLTAGSFMDVTLAGGGGGGSVEGEGGVSGFSPSIYTKDGSIGGTASLIPGQAAPINWNFQNVSTSYLYYIGAAVSAGGGTGGGTSLSTIRFPGWGGSNFGSAGNTRVLLDTALFTISITTHTSVRGNDGNGVAGGSSVFAGVGAGGRGAEESWAAGTLPGGGGFNYPASSGGGVGGGSGGVQSSTLTYHRKPASAGKPLPPIPIALMFAAGGVGIPEAEIRGGSGNYVNFTSITPAGAGIAGFASVTNNGAA